MRIKELVITKTDVQSLEISWAISGSEQSSFELFLIQNGSVAETVKRSSATTQCSLRTMIEPMKEYVVLLTVRCGGVLSSARAGFFADANVPISQRVAYEAHG